MVQNKGTPQTQTTDYVQAPRLPDSPPRVRGFLNKKQQSLSKKQQKLLIVAEVVARSRFLVVFCRIFLQKWLSDLDFLMVFG